MKHLTILLLSLFTFVSSSGFGQKMIHELPRKTNVPDSTWLMMIGNPTAGTLYKMSVDNFRDSVLSIATLGGGTTIDTTSLSNRINLKANIAAPTFTGNVGLPSTTTIGNVSSTEINYVDGATSNIQTQLDRKQKVFNVLNYMAGGYVMGTTDATTGIQAAINACHAAGGGTVYFPNGTYIIGGALKTSSPNSNSQLYIPETVDFATGSDRLTISLVGESSSSFPNGSGIPAGEPYGPITNGVILKSTITTGAAGASVISTGNAAFSLHYFTIDNITIIVEADPSGAGPVVGGVNWRYGNNFRFNNLSVSIDIPPYNSTLPTNDVSGIETPDNGAGSDYSLTNCITIGFRSGLKIGEHVVLNNCNVMCCYYGINVKSATHATTSIRTATSWCAYDINISGSCTLSNFKIDAEWQDIGKWYDDIATINDPSNLARGQVFYTITNAGGANGNSNFIKTGGANLHTMADEHGIASIVQLDSKIDGTVADDQVAFGVSADAVGGSANLKWDGTHLSIGGGSPIAGALNLYQNTADAVSSILMVNDGAAGGGTATPYGQISLFGTNGDGVHAWTNNTTVVEGLATGGLGLSGFGGDIKMMVGITRPVIATITSAGLGIGVSPTALLHIKAGTAAANTAPLKLTAGTHLTTPEAGAVEFDGTHFYGTVGSTRHQLDQQAAGSNTHIQYNNSGAFAGSSNLTWSGTQLSLVTNSDLAASAVSGVSITNSNAGGYANSIWYNSGGDLGQFMMTGSSGAISGTSIRARQATFISAGGTGGLNFFSTAGPIYFTPTGGTTESVTFKTNGIVNLSAASSPVYANDAAAGSGGLVTGDIYQTSAGVLMVKQ